MLDLSSIPLLLQHFLATISLSFLIGLELHSYRRINKTGLGYGTTRTVTLIGILGFTLYVLDKDWRLFFLGMIVVAGFLWIYYWHRVKDENFSLLGPLVALLTYLIGPAVLNLPSWFVMLSVVLLLVLLSEKPGIRQFSDAFRGEEATTLSKFLIMAGVVLPLLPDRQIAPAIPITYYQLWLAVIVVSGISYLSYLAQTYFFKKRGLLLTGILGGLYSSTATTVVIAKRAKEHAEPQAISPAIILATAMMYIRLLLLIAVLGYGAITVKLLIPFLVFMAGSIIVSLVLYRSEPSRQHAQEQSHNKHPLELGTAFVFALLFVVFATLTDFVLARYGTSGLQALSFLVGFSDIDPFILSLLAGKFQVSSSQVASAILMASGSNNLLKAAYAFGLGRIRTVLPAVSWLIILFLATLLYIYAFL